MKHPLLEPKKSDEVCPMEIRIAAAAILRADGATLLVRKHRTSAFMQPGGKIDGDETAVVALCRELFEELALKIRPEETEYIGRFSAPAANKPDCLVTAEFFCLQLNGDVEVQAEIEEALWAHPGTVGQVVLAPLTRDMVLPLIWG